MCRKGADVVATASHRGASMLGKELQENRSAEGDGANGSWGSAESLRAISTWSLFVLALIGVGGVLYLARDILLPIVAAFVVGVMLSPAARRLEALHVPRALAALLIVSVVALIFASVVTLILPRVSELTEGLPGLTASLKEKLHVFDRLASFWQRLTQTLGNYPSESGALPAPSLSWLPTTISVVLPSITEFFFFLVVLLLFITKWPDLRRALVMTFATRDSRLTVLKILNEIEAGLASYLRIVSLINLAVGALAAGICRLTGMPHALGFGALAATLNFIPIIGPAATFLVFLLVGVVTASSLLQGLLPAAAFTLLIVVEGQFVTPTIIGRHLELNALAVLLSLAFWTWLWGPMGAFLSSPILIVALILKQRLYAEEER